MTLICATLFAATFKKGTTVYVSKDTEITETEKSKKAISNAKKGDYGIVIESNSNKTKIEFKESGILGWCNNKNLTKKKIVSNVKTDIDNFALAGKGKKNAKAKEVETETSKQESILKNENSSVSTNE